MGCDRELTVGSPIDIFSTMFCARLEASQIWLGPALGKAGTF